MEALNETLERHGPPSSARGAPARVSVVLPCLDEAESIDECVAQAHRALDAAGVEGEVLVVDNGSSDGSGEIARAAGARVVTEHDRGYGRAYRSGFREATGDYIVMADSDGSYDLADIPRFVAALDQGADVVMGSRLRGHIHPGAMPWLHRRIGNPVLTRILNLFFGTGLSDAHCGMRAFRRDLLPLLDLRSIGMEFASEHLLRSAKLKLDIREIPIDYRPRAGRSKLSSFSDGWRHLRLLLVHSPTWLFLVPGGALVLTGLATATVVLTGADVLGREWRLHALIAAAMLAIIGAQVLQLGLFARSYAVWHLGERDPLLERARVRLRLEVVLAVGLAAAAAGLAVCGSVVVTWLERGFGELREEKLAVVGATLVVLGLQVLFGAFLLSVLGLRRRESEPARDPG